MINTTNNIQLLQLHISHDCRVQTAAADLHADSTINIILHRYYSRYLLTDIQYTQYIKDF